MPFTLRRLPLRFCQEGTLFQTIFIPVSCSFVDKKRLFNDLLAGYTKVLSPEFGPDNDVKVEFDIEPRRLISLVIYTFICVFFTIDI